MRVPGIKKGYFDVLIGPRHPPTTSMPWQLSVSMTYVSEYTSIFSFCEISLPIPPETAPFLNYAFPIPLPHTHTSSAPTSLCFQPGSPVGVLRQSYPAHDYHRYFAVGTRPRSRNDWMKTVREKNIKFLQPIILQILTIDNVFKKY